MARPTRREFAAQVGASAISQNLDGVWVEIDQIEKGAIAVRVRASTALESDHAVVRVFYRTKVGETDVTISKFDVLPLLERAPSEAQFDITLSDVEFVRIDLMQAIERRELRLV